MTYTVFRLPQGTSFIRWNGRALSLWLPDSKYWLPLAWDDMYAFEVRHKCTLVAKNVRFK